ncbi:MAG: hypothetical protein IKW98_12395 [Prevotella sp.]|nr:hypothetical protein [Prevotella sp.]
MDIFIIVLSLIIIGAVIFMTHYQNDKQKKEQKDPLVDIQNQRKDTVAQALKGLNCECKWQTEDDEEVAIFEFQSGHFSIRIKKDTPYVDLLFLFFYQTSVENIHLVRTVCNSCNINIENTRAIYSISDGSNNVDIHAITNILLEQKTAQQVLKRAMNSSFQCRNAFIRQFNESQKDNEQAENHDAEKDKAQWKRELELLSEQEIMHQDDGPGWRSNEAEPLELRNVLATALDLKDIVPQRLTIIANDSIDSMENSDAILAYHLSNPLIKGGDFIADETLLNLKYAAPSMPEAERNINIHLKAERKADQTLYFRVTISVVPLSITHHPTSNIQFGSRENRPAICSFLTAYDLSSPKQRLDKFHYMWKEALELIKTNPEELTEEQRLISECMDSHLSFNIFMGSVMYRDKRFYEAIRYLENAYQYCKSQVKDMKPSEKELFFHICYLIGFCYTELEQYEKAYYYLEMTMPIRRITYTEEYVNCMVNSADFRALDIIDNLMSEAQNPIEDENETPPPHIKAFISFLKRRKAYVLIEQQKFDEAKAMLQQMLDEPENSDFAISELAFLQKRKGLSDS